MKRVIIIISTYNGSKHIRRQLDSIFGQIGVEVAVVIRDDNSKDNTVKVIKDYIQDKRFKVRIITGDNEGYAKSFWDALCLAGDADYYAFSDQDDVWKEDKLIKTINPMENSSYIGPMLSYCKMQRSDENLNCLDEQIKILRPDELSKKICLTQTFNYGAATVINRSAKELICRSWPEGKNVPHDLWAGVLCYWFGQVFFVDEDLYYWIRYGTSVTGEGTKKSGRIYRLKETFRRKTYPNIASELLNNYDDLLLDDDREFLKTIMSYKHDRGAWFKLLCDRDFARSTIAGTLSLKMGIFNKWF